MPPGGLDLPLCVSSGQVFRWEVLDDGRWLGVDGDFWYLVRIDPDRFVVESNGSRADFESLFRLDWNGAEVEAEILRRAPEMAPYVGSLKGLRSMRPSGSVETFFCFLCTPNNNVARITTMVRKLGTYGPVLDTVEGKVLHRFPSVETIAEIASEELWAAAFGYRARTIPDVARQVLDRGGAAWIETLKVLPYQEAHDKLVALKGVGPKLADCIGLFALHHTSAAPVDTHLWQAMTRLYFPEWKDKALTGTRYREAGDFLRGKFGDLTGWAHQYLFYDNLLNWRSRK